MSRKQFRTLADPAEARETIDALELGGGSEVVDLQEAHGRVLAERVDAELDVPGFDRAAMDGYAVRARETFGADEADPVTLDLAGVIHAGEEPDVTVEPGTCAEISTGAVMPEGADAVVIVERTDETEREDGETGIEIRTAVTPGDSVMVAGADIAAGTRAVGPGRQITPREIGLLSALGVDRVPVRAAPKVGIISTGEELVRPGDNLDSSRGEIHDVNSYTVAAGVEAAGGKPVVYPHAGDDIEELERLLRTAADDCDLVLSSGSTSASAVDVIYEVIEDKGELLLHGVAVKPGKPMLVGRLDRSGGGQSAYIGLPGYPVSALTIFRTFVAPAIRDAAGQPEPAAATTSGEMAVEARSEAGRLRLLSVGIVDDGSGRRLVYPVDKGSGATTSLVEADGVVAVDPDTDYLAAGESVTVQLFSPDVEPPALLGIGEDDPALNELLDGLSSVRYLPTGSREGLRRLRDGLPDLAVVAGPVDGDHGAASVGSWHREWGLLVPEGNPDEIDGLGELVDRDVRFINRETNSGLRTSLSNALAELADERDVSRHSLIESIEGFEATVKAFESPARRVIEGRTDVGLGLRTTADKHDLGFVSLGDQRVDLLINLERTEKPAVERLEAVLQELPEECSSLSGYRFPGE
ncbi:molybdopterin biosynthesis protein [Halohasta litorea]|uniref:Molybdopterin biosynthesis protein n=1 Tax=Halohasta litorea TaxID=869891 RepID=A0ABD6DBC3_9EURY|nr:molybdopterin biosynthesis protein [Halohasta litorea]